MRHHGEAAVRPQPLSLLLLVNKARCDFPKLLSILHYYGIHPLNMVKIKFHEFFYSKFSIAFAKTKWAKSLPFVSRISQKIILAQLAGHLFAVSSLVMTFALLDKHAI